MNLEQQLLQLYAGLQLPVSEGNRCGQCRTCCTAAGLTRQNVTGLELALLERAHGAERAARFARYARREKRPDGSYEFEVCPNLEEQGCRVYVHRPFSCRVFGHFRTSQSRLPPECVYNGEELVFEAPRYYQVIPGALRLRELSRDYQLRLPPSAAAPDQGGVGLNLNDPWDRSLEQISQGLIPDLPEEAPEDSLFASYVRALVYGQTGRHREALRHYQRVLSECPKRADLMTFAGFEAFQLGELAEAEGLWLKALELDQENPLTYSFLGYLSNHRGEWQMAADYFGAAATLQPEQPLHDQRRQHALSQLCQPEPTSPHL